MNHYYQDLAPQAASTVPWITFGGLPTESSSAFVQSVQRVGFQQGKGRDDGWMAEYAATCFEGDALTWYSELDDEIQDSWKKLRANVLRKYPHVTGVGTPMPLLSAPQPAIVPSAPVGIGASAASTSHSQGLVGIIEVLSSHTVLLGYLSFDPTSGIDITTDKEKAVIISFPLSKGPDVLHLDMVRQTPAAFELSDLLLPSIFCLLAQHSWSPITLLGACSASSSGERSKRGPGCASWNY